MFEAGLDLNVARSIPGFSNRTVGVANEHGKTRFCAGHGASAADHVSPLLCAAGYNLRWLLLAMVRPGLTALLLRPLFLELLGVLRRANTFRRTSSGVSSLVLFRVWRRRMNFSGPTR